VGLQRCSQEKGYCHGLTAVVPVHRDRLQLGRATGCASGNLCAGSSGDDTRVWPLLSCTTTGHPCVRLFCRFWSRHLAVQGTSLLYHFQHGAGGWASAHPTPLHLFANCLQQHDCPVCRQYPHNFHSGLFMMLHGGTFMASAQ
jgi:hypothetical protein